MGDLRIPDPALVVLVGPSGAGKTHWALTHFDESEVVSSDRLRAAVGESESDLDASADAFELLDAIVDKRLARQLLTVVDTLGFNPGHRASLLARARAAGMPAAVVVFDTPADVCRSRNRRRDFPVPARVLSDQLKAFRSVRPLLNEEGFDLIIDGDGTGDDLIAVASSSAAPAAPVRQAPAGLAFDLQISAFDFGDIPTGPALSDLARTAEQVGFDGIWVMDHFRQIPQIGREWEDMLESYTTLGYLAGVTNTVRLGTLVTGVTYRNPAHLAKIVATLDVVSGGRAVCGLGAGWFEDEHRAYGWPFPSDRERLDLLEDVLQLLPLMWGKGSPPFHGKVIDVPETMCYPRPVQEKIPILVGGSGEKRTLRLVARYADACNFFGNPDNVSGKIEVLAKHCRELGRPLDEIEVTHLSSAVVGHDRGEVRDAVDRRRGRGSRASAAARLGAGTIEEQVARFSEYASRGVRRAIVSFPEASPAQLEGFREVIAAFDEPRPK